MGYPIPTHLKTIFKVNEAESNKDNLNGKIVCECGCDCFSIFHNLDRKYDKSLRYNEQDGLKVIAVCKNCKKKHLIFDEATQGYNGYVCRDCITAQDESLVKLMCKKCGSEIFSMVVEIELEDKEQFIEECVSIEPDRFTPDDYIDAFDWITIDVTCKNCGEEDSDWISLELA